MTGQRQVYSLDLLSCSEEMYSSADTRGTFVFVNLMQSISDPEMDDLPVFFRHCEGPKG